MYIVIQLTKKELKYDLAKAFMHLDIDNDGKLSRADLNTCYFGLLGSEAEANKVVDSIFTNLDHDKNGFIDYTGIHLMMFYVEYLLASVNKKEILTKESLSNSFYFLCEVYISYSF